MRLLIKYRAVIKKIRAINSGKKSQLVSRIDREIEIQRKYMRSAVAWPFSFACTNLQKPAGKN